jgi:hypothetical protein
MGTIAPYSPKKMEAEGPKREKTGKRKERRRGKRKVQEKGKRNEMQIFFFFSLLVDIYGFFDGRGRDCVILHDEGLLFYSKSLFPERFQREPMGRKHASSESSPIRRELRTQRLPAALPLVNNCSCSCCCIIYIVARITTGATAMEPRTIHAIDI